MIIKYNKLIRDRIPEIIESNGKVCKTEILSDAEYVARLDEKLNEECADSIIELATATVKIESSVIRHLESKTVPP